MSQAEPAPGGSSAPDDRETSEVLASLVANVRALVKKEIELAKLEVQRILVEKVIAVVAALAGALVALFILAFAGVTIAKALELVFAPWLAWLIVTGIYTLVALVALFVAYRLARRPVVPERTKRDVQDTVAWAKKQVQP
jgi:hypothetical protein